MSCHVMASRAMPGHIFTCHAIFLRVMPCHEYSMPCHVRIFRETFFFEKISNDTSVDPKQPVYFEIKKPPWVSVVWVVIACCICSKHDPCICSKQCNVALSASIAPVAAKSCKRSCQTSAPVLRPSVHSALRPKCYLRPRAQSSAPAFTAP